MLLGPIVLIFEPPPTRYDLRFRLAGFPVRIHPAFWLISALLGFDAEQFDAVELLLWVLVVFVSILVHELGHALAVRRFGWDSRIILYHLGGLATVDPPRDAFLGNDEELSPKAKIMIAAAGPAAGFLLAGALIGVLLASPIGFHVARHSTLGLWFRHDLDHGHYPHAAAKLEEAANAAGKELQVGDESLADYARKRRLGTLIDALLYVNIFWGLMNLLPVIPLDGGQISRELFCLRHPRSGLEKALRVSMIVGIVVAVAGLLHFGLHGGLFFAVMFGLLAYINYRVLQQVRAMGGPGGPDDYGGYEPEDWWKR